MSSITMRVIGAGDFRRAALAALQSIDDQTEQVLDGVADATLQDSQDNTPVKTGQLRDSEEIEKERLRRIVGTNLDYSIYVHQGTYKMAARPFLFNASERNRGKFVRDCLAIKV